MEQGPKSPVRSNTSSKVQVMAQILEKSQIKATRLNGHNLPGLVHMIS